MMFKAIYLQYLSLCHSLHTTWKLKVTVENCNYESFLSSKGNTGKIIDVFPLGS